MHAMQFDLVEIRIGEKDHGRIVTRFREMAARWSRATVSRSAARLISRGAMATPAAHSEQAF